MGSKAANQGIPELAWRRLRIVWLDGGLPPTAFATQPRSSVDDLDDPNVPPMARDTCQENRKHLQLRTSLRICADCDREGKSDIEHFRSSEAGSAPAPQSTVRIDREWC